MNSIKRRTFLKSGVAASALGFPALGQVRGANDRVQVALIGCGGRGTQVTASLAKRSDVECTQICDIHEDRLVRIADHMAEQQGGRKPLLARRMEEVYANKDVDAVVVATPDHWHTPASILACQAGKDVYVEKPFSHNIWEGRKLVEAARIRQSGLGCGAEGAEVPFLGRQPVEIGREACAVRDYAPVTAGVVAGA